MCNKPVLQQPDFTKPFIVLTDASAYGVEAILSQEGEVNPQKPIKKPKLHLVVYYSVTFTATKRGYDIYERELLVIIKAITHWRPSGQKNHSRSVLTMQTFFTGNPPESSTDIQ